MNRRWEYKMLELYKGLFNDQLFFFLWMNFVFGFRYIDIRSDF